MSSSSGDPALVLMVECAISFLVSGVAEQTFAPNDLHVLGFKTNESTRNSKYVIKTLICNSLGAASLPTTTPKVEQDGGLGLGSFSKSNIIKIAAQNRYIIGHYSSLQRSYHLERAQNLLTHFASVDMRSP
ncbi:hypothetical protein PIIN_08225 [Serendipita indica DSM 11827]|uniref:Uncharacterized protein n=1 Tax=Serendipita indica (strain DSM 11827) TaxID=1109443 RepID=G4TSI1_SERID|nr:hypothetical protein PIIN_08225 [Serendipita indica DSM 11827]